jgi:hypothetical protein
MTKEWHTNFLRGRMGMALRLGYCSIPFSQEQAMSLRRDKKPDVAVVPGYLLSTHRSRRRMGSIILGPGGEEKGVRVVGGEGAEGGDGDMISRWGYNNSARVGYVNEENDWLGQSREHIGAVGQCWNIDLYHSTHELSSNIYYNIEHRLFITLLTNPRDFVFHSRHTQTLDRDLVGMLRASSMRNEGVLLWVHVLLGLSLAKCDLFWPETISQEPSVGFDLGLTYGFSSPTSNFGEHY